MTVEELKTIYMRYAEHSMTQTSNMSTRNRTETNNLFLFPWWGYSDEKAGHRKKMYCSL